MRIASILIFLLSLPSAAMAQEWLDKILTAALLPVSAAEARDAGVPDAQVRDILGVLRRTRLPADDAWRVLDEEVRVVREGGPKDNFGAFVQTQLDAGLRGRELAEAIREEHRRQGIGRPDGKARPAGRGDKAGRDNAKPKGEPGSADAFARILQQKEPPKPEAMSVHLRGLSSLCCHLGYQRRARPPRPS
jgi:hypothetical protein